MEMEDVRTVDVECSPRTYQMVQDNPDMIEQILGVHHQVEMQSPGELVSSIKFENNDDDEDEDLLEETDSSTKIIWHDASVGLLLTLVKELRGKVGKTARLKTIKRMWEIIQTRMQEQGYNYTSGQIENKFRGLEKKFKTAQSLKARGVSKYKPCAFEGELADILQGSPSIFSSHIVGDGEHDYTLKPRRRRKNQVKNEVQVVNGAASMGGSIFYESGTANYTSIEVSAPSSSVAQECQCRCPLKAVKLDDILQEVKQMRESKEIFHKRVIKLMEEGNKRREQLLQEKNGIYKQILDSVNRATQGN